VNNLERVAAAHHATFLVLDETRLADDSNSKGKLFGPISNAVMHLAEGTVKGRLTDDSASTRSSLSGLGTSNFSLDEMASREGAFADDALRGRLIDVPLPPGIVGAFENLHGYRDHAAFCAELLRIARKNHGVAINKFLYKLTSWRQSHPGRPEEWLKEQRRWFADLARRRIRSPSRDLARTHEKLATVFAGAELALRYRILPWSREMLVEALLECEQAHVAYVEQFVASMPAHPMLRGVGAARRNLPLGDPLEPLKAHVCDRSAALVDLRRGLIDPASDHDHDSCDGYLNRRKDGNLEYLFSEARLLKVCGGKAAVLQVKRQLEVAGMLYTDGNRPSTRRPIWARRKSNREQVIAIRAEAFQF
jgi:hypothetical protein